METSGVVWGEADATKDRSEGPSSSDSNLRSWSLYTWGRAKNFRLGRTSTSTDSREPERVSSFEGVPVKQVACGGGHTCVILEDDRLFVFGYSQYGQLGLGDRVDVCEPALVRFSERGGAVGNGGLVDYRIAQVACGRYHTVALTTAGQVFTWGGGKNGRLGHGDEKVRTLPTRVATFNAPVQMIACGYHSNLAVSNRRLYTWGWGAHGQLGHDDFNDRMCPEVIPDFCEVSGMTSFRDRGVLENIVQLACGDRHCFALTDRGAVYAWGSNEFGQLGINLRGQVITRATRLQSLAALVVKGISAGDKHSAAVTNLGTVYTWGCSADGQCGHGNVRDVLRPKALTSLPQHVLEVRCGHNFTLARTADHEVYTWGNNWYGQLGIGRSDEIASVPRRIALNSPAWGVTCAHFHCALWIGKTKLEDDRSTFVCPNAEGDVPTPNGNAFADDDERAVLNVLAAAEQRCKDTQQQYEAELAMEEVAINDLLGLLADH